MSASVGIPAEKRRPNVLLIATDQQRHDHLGCVGTPGIVTPHLDELARRGTWFRRAYCPSPICTPTRVSLLTGQYPSSHGAYSIGVTADPFPSPTLPELLGRAGYSTALIGKSHFVSRQDELAHIRGMHGACDEDFKNWSGPYVGFDYVKMSSGHTINCVPNMHYREFLESHVSDYRDWFPQMGDSYDNQVAGSWALPSELHDTHWVTEESLKWLRGQKADRPWFLWASLQDPHEPFVCPEPWFSQVDRDALQVFPGAPAHGFLDRPAFYNDVLREGEAGWRGIDDGHGVPCIFQWPQMQAQARTALQATAGMLRFLDDRIGALVSYLREQGQLENTLIVFTSDHGEMHGHHGYWGKGLMAFEDCQRVPLIMAGPGIVTQETHALANLVDLPHTILSRCGCEVPESIQGHDLSPLLSGGSEAVTDHTFVECEATHRIGQLTCVTDTWKVVAYRDSGYGEFYDLANDPDQLRNRWDDQEIRAVRDDILRKWIWPRLSQWPRRQPRKAFA